MLSRLIVGRLRGSHGVTSSFVLNGHAARHFCSSGQHKLFLRSLDHLPHDAVVINGSERHINLALKSS